MNTFGRFFRISIFGESHSPVMGAVINGIPAGMPLCEEDMYTDIARRSPGLPGTTPRNEKDRPRIMSGTFGGRTTGAPVCIEFDNGDCRPEDYVSFRDIPRPGHADYSRSMKWNGAYDPRGGGQASGRMTLPVVAAGVIAKKMLGGISVAASLVEVGGCCDPSAPTAR